MILPWVVAVAALAVAVLAWSRARRTARRLDQLLEMYWELKYQHGELRRDLQHLSGQSHQSPDRPAVSGAEPPAVSGVERPKPADAFVPLASLKR